MLNHGWTFETHEYLSKKPRLTKKGQEMLNTCHFYELFKVLRAHTFDANFETLNCGEIFFGPDWKTDCFLNKKNNQEYRLLFNLYQVTSENKFKVIENNEENRKLARPDLTLYVEQWFKYKGKLYWPSRISKKIEPVSDYWTKEGIEYIMSRVSTYNYISKNIPKLFRVNDLRQYRRIPTKWVTM